MIIDPYIAQIEKTESQAQLWRLMVHMARDLGFGAVGYLLVDKGRTGRANAMLQHGFHPAIVTFFRETGFGVHDPTMRVAFSTGRPWIVGEVEMRFKLTKAEIRHKKLINAHAHADDGLGLPLFGPNGRDAYVALGRPVTRNLPWKINRIAVQMIAQAAHLRGLYLGSSGTEGGKILTEREVEILRWVAMGKSNNAIAEQLDVSAGTVDTYLRRIFHKLDVADRTSAAVKGVSMGLIRV